MSENLKEVRFDKYCTTCKHNKPDGMFNPNIGYDDGENGWSGLITKEEITPCCFCIEEAAREGTEVPVEWEAK
mgnify:CR=1 FL=1